MDKSKYGKEILLEELKVVQMDVLTAIDEFCAENNIRYSMACGTLLGAVRHKGYIPWDDDIDIYVPREDYKRLIELFPPCYKGRYKITSLERDPLWEKPYAKAYDDKTILFEKADVKEIIGVNIDIFPVDEVPDLQDEWFDYDKTRRKLVYSLVLRTVKLDKKRPFIKNVTILLYRLLSYFYPIRKQAYKLDAYAQKNNGNSFSRYFECCQGLIQKNPFPKNLFDKVLYIPFEDRKFMAFEDSDCYLRNGFGDYMKLPPKEKQLSHHAFKAYWKN